MYSVCEEDRKLLHTKARNLSFKTWKSVFTKARFRSSSSKPLYVNAALDSRLKKLADLSKDIWFSRFYQTTKKSL